MCRKYVLVGLVLILPGNPLCIEGRGSEDHGGAREDDTSLLKSLREYLNRQGPSGDVPGQVPPGDGALNPGSIDTSLVEDVRNSETVIQDNSKNPQSLSRGGHELSKNSEEPTVQEVGRDMPQHLALAVRQSGSGKVEHDSIRSVTFIMIVAGCTVVAAIAIVGAGVCWYKYNKRVSSARTVDYPAYGVTGPTKDQLPSPGDRTLAKSAQMFHFEHQKQQMIAMEKANGSMKHDASDEESEEDNVEGDYTVYECPGLAPTGEMEVKNPLFHGDETPTTPVAEDPPPPQDK